MVYSLSARFVLRFLLVVILLFHRVPRRAASCVSSRAEREREAFCFVCYHESSDTYNLAKQKIIIIKGVSLAFLQCDKKVASPSCCVL